MTTHQSRLLWVAVIITLSVACDRSSEAKKVDTIAVDFDGHECAACSMIVRDQPAPRGQLVHRDGTRSYFCSVSDMLTYLQAPSPHGEAVAVYVETNDPNGDPNVWSRHPRPWVETSRASYVLGVKNPQIMGEPILVYESRTDADRIAKTIEGGRSVDWTNLKASQQP